MDIISILQAQKAFFASGKTLDVKWREQQLRKLLASVGKWEQALYDALWQDLHKSRQESYLCEVSVVTGEIREHLRHLRKWARPEAVKTPLSHFPARSRVVKEALGNTLIIAPWNYPLTLLLCPLVGAISAGCTAVLKPSPYAPNVSEVLRRLVEDAFPAEYVALVQGHRDVNAELLAQRWDLIFFTGSPVLGRTVMAEAAKNLTPVVLELGGKSPCIVDKSADIALAARRIAWGKTLNAGQTCIAPDYLLIHKDVKDAFVSAWKREVAALHGENPQASPHYGRIVSDKAFRRVKAYLSDGQILAGGRTDESERYVEPTLLGGADPSSPVMSDEIFGPVLPLLEFTSLEEVTGFVNDREKPLAFYFFGKPADGRMLIRRTSSGGACINDTIMHFANGKMPFGGVGNSGMGRYHGRDSFESFSHRRSVLISSVWPDLPFRYMPYKAMGLVKKILR